MPNSASRASKIPSTSACGSSGVFHFKSVTAWFGLLLWTETVNWIGSVGLGLVHGTPIVTERLEESSSMARLEEETRVLPEGI